MKKLPAFGVQLMRLSELVVDLLQLVGGQPARVPDQGGGLGGIRMDRWVGTGQVVGHRLTGDEEQVAAVQVQRGRELAQQLRAGRVTGEDRGDLGVRHRRPPGQRANVEAAQAHIIRHERVEELKPALRCGCPGPTQDLAG